MKKINLLFVFSYFLVYSSLVSAEVRDIKYLASLCYSCHATNNSSSRGIQSLLGYNKKKFSQFFDQISKSKDKSDVMYQIAQGYSKNEIMLMAEFFATQK